MSRYIPQQYPTVEKTWMCTRLIYVLGSAGRKVSHKQPKSVMTCYSHVHPQQKSPRVHQCFKFLHYVACPACSNLYIRNILKVKIFQGSSPKALKNSNRSWDTRKSPQIKAKLLKRINRE